MPEQPMLTQEMIEHTRQNDPPTGREVAPLPHLIGEENVASETKKIVSIEERSLVFALFYLFGSSMAFYLAYKYYVSHDLITQVITSAAGVGTLIYSVKIYRNWDKHRKENAG